MERPEQDYVYKLVTHQPKKNQITVVTFRRDPTKPNHLIGTLERKEVKTFGRWM